MINSTWKAGALLALAVIAGGAAGSAFTAHSAACSAGTAAKQPGEGFVSLLTTELALTAAQQDSVRVVLARHNGAMDALWDEIRPRVDSLRGVIRSEIAPHLTAEQQAKFTALTARLDAERREQREKSKGTTR